MDASSAALEVSPQPKESKLARVEELRQAGRSLGIKQVRLDMLTPVETRVALNEAAVLDYEQSIRDGVELPPGIMVVDFKANRRWLAAGAHRGEAHRRAGDEIMASEVLFGTKWDAIQIGIEDNRKFNGVRVTRADKALQITLALKEQPHASGRAIAELVGVDNKTVEARRAKLIEAGDIPRFEEHVGIDGLARKLSDPKPATKEPDPVLVAASTAEPGKADTLSAQDGPEEPAGSAQINAPADNGQVNREHASTTGAPGEPVHAVQAADAAICPPKARRREQAAQELAEEAPSVRSPDTLSATPTLQIQGTAAMAEPALTNQDGPPGPSTDNLALVDAALAALEEFSARVDALLKVPSTEGPGTFASVRRCAREAKAGLDKWRNEFAM